MNMRLVVAFASLLLPPILFGCEAGDSAAGKSDAVAKAGPPPVEVEMVPAIRKAISLQQLIPGRLQAVRIAEVRARVEGIVEKQLFVEGSEVSSGNPLYRLDARSMEVHLKSAQAALDRAEAEHLLAKQTLNRLSPLVASNAVSKQDFDEAKAQHKKTSAGVATAEAALAQARINLEYATITAPIGGRIGRTNVTEGALVGQKEPTHMVTIEQIDPIWVNFTQSSPELFRLRRAIQAGSAHSIKQVKIRLLLEDDVEYPHPGTLNFTDMTVDPQTGSVALRAEFPNPDRTLLSGQFVRVQLALATTEGITVPQRAVQTSPQGEIVLMVGADNKVVPRPVTTGGFSGQDWVITTGLQAGEKVIITGVQKVRPGSVVKPKDQAVSIPVITTH